MCHVNCQLSFTLIRGCKFLLAYKLQSSSNEINQIVINGSNFLKFISKLFKAIKKCQIVEQSHLVILATIFVE